MGHGKKGDDFLEGQISNENMAKAQHQHGGQGTLPPPTLILCGVPTVGTENLQILPTCPGHVCGIGPECCWIILATTNCTTTRPNGTTCCWRILATTDCTTTRGGEACCWHVLSTTDCTNIGCPTNGGEC